MLETRTHETPVVPDVRNIEGRGGEGRGTGEVRGPVNPHKHVRMQPTTGHRALSSSSGPSEYPSQTSPSTEQSMTERTKVKHVHATHPKAARFGNATMPALTPTPTPARALTPRSRGQTTPQSRAQG